MPNTDLTTERGYHTRGPWRLNERACWHTLVIAADGVAMCKMAGGSYPEDARLIAAAPELLDSLKELHFILRDGMQGDYDDMVAALRRARLTIEKAEGVQ